jgi:Phosphotransferase system, galactitol-specific IIB component
MKIVAVCGFGVGSSLLLKISLDKAFKALEMDEEAMNTDIITAKSITCDAIFTSVDMAEQLRAEVKVPVYAIRRYMDVNEVQAALEECIADYNAK